MKTEYVAWFGALSGGISLLIQMFEFFQRQLEKRKQKKGSLLFNLSRIETALTKFQHIEEDFYFFDLILTNNGLSTIYIKENSIRLKFKKPTTFSTKVKFGIGEKPERGTKILEKGLECRFRISITPVSTSNKQFLLKTPFKIIVNDTTGKKTTSRYLLLRDDPSADRLVDEYDLRF